MQRQSVTLLMSAFVVALGSLLITPPVSAAGPERVLYNFCSVTNCADGTHSWAGLIFDSAGNLYSTTADGGSLQCYNMDAEGCGTVCTRWRRDMEGDRALQLLLGCKLR
jgi:hypothetical protein